MMENMEYLVVESFKGNEEIVFVGKREECNVRADEIRNKIRIEERTVHDVYVESVEERNKYRKLTELYKKYDKEIPKEKRVYETVDGHTYDVTWNEYKLRNF